MENNQYRIRALARSKAGHDKGDVFVVAGEREERVLLADGKGRTLKSPKAKNPAHVQLITRFSEELAEQIRRISSDDDVRRILKQYKQEETHVKE